MMKEENFSKCVVILLLVVAVLLFATICIGCGTAYGLASDAEVASGWLRRKLKSTLDQRDRARIYLAEEEQKAKVREAADLILAEQEKGKD